jgi:hypothetical protein
VVIHNLKQYFLRPSLVKNPVSNQGKIKIIEIIKGTKAKQTQ